MRVIAHDAKGIHMFGWNNAHHETCEVTKERAGLESAVRNAFNGGEREGDIEYLIGAWREYDNGGDEERELCTCDFFDGMTHEEWCQLRVLSEKAMRYTMKLVDDGHVEKEKAAPFIQMLNEGYAVANAVIKIRFEKSSKEAMPF